MKKTKFFVLAAILLLAGSCNIFNQAPKDNQDQTAQQEEQMQAETNVFSYEGVEGVDALTLLKQSYAVETQDFGSGLGEFVKEINGVEPTDNQFWSLYVNGQQAQVGAASYITKAGDKVEWRLEEIKSY